MTIRRVRLVDSRRSSPVAVAMQRRHCHSTVVLHAVVPQAGGALAVVEEPRSWSERVAVVSEPCEDLAGVRQARSEVLQRVDGSGQRPSQTARQLLGGARSSTPIDWSESAATSPQQHSRVEPESVPGIESRRAVSEDAGRASHQGRVTGWRRIPRSRAGDTHLRPPRPTQGSSTAPGQRPVRAGPTSPDNARRRRP